MCGQVLYLTFVYMSMFMLLWQLERKTMTGVAVAVAAVEVVQAVRDRIG
jgi:hypothetical protein